MACLASPEIGDCQKIVKPSEERVKELEEEVLNLFAQNEILKNQNERLTKELLELKKNSGQKGDLLECSEGNLTAKIATPCNPTVVGRSRRRKKNNALNNDMSHYATRHVALKLMYLGARYHGFASQAGLQKTVETELFTALQRTRLIRGTAADANYSRCGRTDKGVSAIGQVIALYLRSKQKLVQKGDCPSVEKADNYLESKNMLSSERETEEFSNEGATSKEEVPKSDGDRVARARASRKLEAMFASTASDEDELDYVGVLNRALPEDIRVLGWCPVPEGFNARFSCLYREYKYFFVDNGLNIDAMKVACKKFEGDHNFSNFCKMDAANVHNYMRTVSNFDILPINEMWNGKRVWIMKVKGTAFLWHQVRCMAAVLFMVGSGLESPTIVEEMLDVKKYVRKPQYIMAPETPLLLFHCGFQGLSFHCHPDSVIRLRLHLEALLQDSIVNASLVSQGLLELQFSENRDMEMISLVELQTKKSTHIPLVKRPTEPTYEERWRMMQSAGELVKTDLVKCALKYGEPLLPTRFCRSLSGGPRTSTGSKGPGADDDVVKQAFATQQKRFRMYIEEMAKQKVDLDTSEASVKSYFQLREKIREKLGVDSYTCKIAGLLEEASDDSPDVRSFLEQYRSFRIETGIEDDLGADALMFAALDKVEKNIKKRLTKDNADGISQLKREFDQINAQLKLKDSELEQLEDEAEMAVVKAELMELASTGTEKMTTFMRRDDLKVDINIKDLDPRSCL